MIDTIIGPIIGGFIAGIAGISIVFLQNYLNKKKEQALIVSELLIEVGENLIICTDPAIRELWWTVKYKTHAYDKHKGKIDFLPEAICNELAKIAYLVEPVNSSVDVHRLMSALQTHYDPSAFKPIPPFKPLAESLLFCRDGLESWQKKYKSRKKFWRRRPDSNR